MVDNSRAWPINYSLSRHTNQKANDFQLNMSKGIPCHVTKVEKDMVTVAFDTKNNVWTVPTMKMPQAFSPYARDATQVGDHGMASPSDYYLGGNTGLGGGVADYGPRANLTPLVFHPMSRTQSQQRDYDQYTVTGGKTGVKIWQGPVPTQQSQQQSNPLSALTGLGSSLGALGQAARAIPHVESERRSTALLRAPRARTTHWRPGGFTAARAAPMATDATSALTSLLGGGSTSDQQSSSKPSGTSLTIDKQGAYTLDGTNKYRMTVQQAAQKVTVEVPAQGGKVWVGGPGQQGELYAPIMTPMGPAVNAMAKYMAMDEQLPGDDGTSQ